MVSGYHPEGHLLTSQDTSSPLGNVARRIVLSLQKASFAKLCDLVQGFRRAIGNTKAEFLPSQLEQVIHLMAHDVLPGAHVILSTRHSVLRSAAMLSSPKLSDTFAVLKGPTVPAVSASVRWHFIQLRSPTC